MGAATSIDVDLSDVGDDLDHGKRFLGSYTLPDVENYFVSHVQPHIRAPYSPDGYRVVLDTSDPFVHQVTVTHDRLRALSADASFLIKLFVRRTDLTPAQLVSGSWHPVEAAHFDATAAAAGLEARQRAPGSEALRVSFLEYLYMQDPLGEWKAGRSPLPSQRFPSLGVSRQMLGMLAAAAREHARDMLANRPEASVARLVRISSLDRSSALPLGLHVQPQRLPLLQPRFSGLL